MKGFHGFNSSQGGSFDWNGNGKNDTFDSYMDMKASGCDNSDNVEERNETDTFDCYMDMKASGCDNLHNVEEGNETDTNLSSFCGKPSDSNHNKELKGITLGGKLLYDASKDSSGTTILKCLLVAALCIGGVVLPLATDMGILGTVLSIFSGLGLSILILKNV